MVNMMTAGGAMVHLCASFAADDHSVRSDNHIRSILGASAILNRSILGAS